MVWNDVVYLQKKFGSYTSVIYAPTDMSLFRHLRTLKRPSQLACKNCYTDVVTKLLSASETLG